MTAMWRIAGLNYVNYSNIAARVLRRSIKGALKDDQQDRKTTIKYYYWSKGEMMPAGKKPEIDKERKSIDVAA